jgi:CRP-like cAMP-binding protein
MLVTDKEKYLPKLKKVALFKYFDDDAIQDFFNRAEVHSFKEGETIISEGEASPYFYAVLDGSVNVTTRDGAKTVFLSTIGEGSIFGEAGIFMNVKRTANVESATGTVLLRNHRSHLMQFIKERPADGVKFLMIVVYTLLKKLRDTDMELAFERKSDVAQDEIDSMVREIMLEDKG